MAYDTELEKKIIIFLMKMRNKYQNLPNLKK